MGKALCAFCASCFRSVPPGAPKGKQTIVTIM
jgi:hypothetical protein